MFGSPSVRQSSSILHVEYLPHELGVQADLLVVDELAIQYQGELLDVWRVHPLALDRREAGLLELVHVPTGGDAEIVGLGHMPLGGDADGELAAFDEVVIGVRGLAQRDADAGRAGTTDAAPGGGHGVGLAFLIICADHEDGSGIDQCAGTDGLLHFLTLADITDRLSFIDLSRRASKST